MTLKAAWIFLLITILGICGSALAATVTSSTINNGQLIINGTGFMTLSTVIFNGKSLPVVSNSNVQIVATLNPLPLPGTYKFVVKSGKPSITSYVTTNIVAQVAFVNQQGQIPVTTLVTPQVDALYHVTVFIEILQFANTCGLWDLNVLGYAYNGNPEVIDLRLSDCPASNPYLKTEEVFLQSAGMPLVYSLSNLAYPNSSAYSVFITVEQVQSFSR